MFTCPVCGRQYESERDHAQTTFNSLATGEALCFICWFWVRRVKADPTGFVVPMGKAI